MLIDFISSIDSREIATLIWLSVLVIWAVTKTNVRKSFSQLIDALFAKQIIITSGLMALYIYIGAVLLWKIGLWESSQLKTTVIWCISVGPVMIVKVVGKDEENFIGTVKDSFKLSIILDVYVNLITLPLVGEIILLPVAALLTGVYVFSENREEYEAAGKFVYSLLAIIGISLVVWVTYNIIKEPGSVFNYGTFLNISTPLLLTTIYIPFLYLLYVYTIYEQTFIRVKFLMPDEKLFFYVKRKSFSAFFCDIQTLKKWSRYVQENDFISKATINQSLQAVSKVDDNP